MARATGWDGEMAVIGGKDLRTNRLKKASAELKRLFGGMQTDTNTV